MKQVLVTGGAGFVGANVVRRLVAEGYAVHLFLRSGSDTWRLRDVLPQLKMAEVDLADARAVAANIERIKPHHILHLAAHGGYSSQTDPQRMFDANLMGTLHLLQAAAAVGCASFVNTGSSSEYGFQDHAPAEEEKEKPNSWYATTKAAATQSAAYVAGAGKLNAVTLRLYSVYGPYEEPSRFIPTLILRARKNGYPPLVDATVARDFVFIDDVVDAYLAAMACRDKAGEIYNVGSGTQTSIGDAVEVARRTFRLTGEPVWGEMPNRQWDTQVWKANVSKIKRDLGWASRVSFADGFRRTADWLEQNPPLIEEYERRQRALPRS